MEMKKKADMVATMKESNLTGNGLDGLSDSSSSDYRVHVRPLYNRLINDN
jgi:hypothetical protein